MQRLDVLRLQERVERATGCLFGAGTLSNRFEYFKGNFMHWLTGPGLGFDAGEQQLFDEATRLMQPADGQAEPWRMMSEREMEECAGIWLQLLLAVTRRAGIASM